MHVYTSKNAKQSLEGCPRSCINKYRGKSFICHHVLFSSHGTRKEMRALVGKGTALAEALKLKSRNGRTSQSQNMMEDVNTHRKYSHTVEPKMVATEHQESASSLGSFLMQWEWRVCPPKRQQLKPERETKKCGVQKEWGPSISFAKLHEGVWMR